MMERGFIAQKTKEFHIKKYLESKLNNVGLSMIKLKKIPLGEKIIIYTSRPSLIVGSKGANIKELTRYLKKEFKLENPQVEINEIKEIFLDANVVAEKIAYSLERFGPSRFKGVGHKTIENVMKSGALGVEIIISGKIPGARAKSWRFYQGYLKKCGDVALVGVRKAKKFAALKSGVIGIKVSIMPADIELPDKIKILDEPIEIVEEITEEKTTKKKGKRKTTKKKPAKKKAAKKEEEKVEEKVEETHAKEVSKDDEVVEEIIKEIKEEKVVEETPKEEPKEEPQTQETPKEEDIPSAESLIEEMKEKFAEDEKPVEKKEKKADDLIEEAKEVE